MLSRRDVLVVLPFAVGKANAQGRPEGVPWPTRAVRFIVSSAAGSAGDLVCRMLAAKLTAAFGQQFVIDNRAAAGGMVASADLAHAVPDGYTIGMVSTSTHVIARIFNRELQYDPEKDFVPVTLIGSSPYVLAVHPGLPAGSVAELVSLGKAKPGSLSNAAFGRTSLGYLASVLFAHEAGIELNQVSYSSSAQAVLDVVAGRIEMQFSTLPPAVPLIRDGKLRGLATTGEHRVATLPDIPTLAEVGFPGYEAALWLGIAAPAGTPPAIVAKLNDELTAILSSNQGQAALQQESFVAEPGPPARLTQRIAADLKKWQDIAAAAGIQAE